jgi:putative ABC transport system permease protein
MGISLTFSITVIPLFQKVAMDEIFINHYSDFQKMDYNVNFEYPTDKGAIVAIKELVDLSEIEGKIEFPFEVENKWKSKILNIIGISRDTNFYQFKNLSGEKINLPKEGMVISEGMAKTLDIKKGDVVKVNTFIPSRDDKYVEVVDIVKQNLGANGYMNIDYMQKEFMEKKIFTGAYIKTTDDVEKRLENMKNVLSIQSTGEMMNGFKKYMNLFYMSVFFIILFSFILGFAIIYNSTIISINERRLEFSSLRVMGFTKNEIFKTVLYENIIMTIFGIIIGIPIAALMVKGIGSSLSNELYNLNVEMPRSVYIYSGILTILFVVISQLATYNKIHKLNFIDALKNRVS